MTMQDRVEQIVDEVKRTTHHLSRRAQRNVVEVDQTVRSAAVDRGLDLARKIAAWMKPATRAGLAPDVQQEVQLAVRDTVVAAIPGYDSLNVQQVDDRVREIDDVNTLAVVACYERDHKGRVTVERAIERQLRRLQPHVPPAPEWMSAQDAA